MRINLSKFVFLGVCLTIPTLIRAADAAPCVWWVSCHDTTTSDLVEKASMITQLDDGQLVQGHIDDRLDQKNQSLERLSVWMTQEMVIQKRLDIQAGVGGIYFYAIPGGDIGDVDGSYLTLTKFGPGISRADMTYSFGDLDHSPAALQIGYFPYKYNPDAKDLGEYLLRSGTYPGTVVSGDWNFLANANYMMEGVRFNVSLWNGKFRTDFLLPMEHDIPPMGDLSPSFVTAVDPVRGLEIGGGVDCNHCISVKPSLDTPHYIVPGGQVVNGLGRPSNDYIISNPDTAARHSTPYVRDTTQFYTFVGVKLMGRASFSPQAYIPMPFLNPEDLRIYGEIAVLGVKDYPFYYNDIYRRMPIMWGINLPTFRVVDALSFEMEYYNTKFPNSLYNPLRQQVPTPNMYDANGNLTEDPNLGDQNQYIVTGQRWHWDVYARKTVVKGLSVYAQVANDHIRVPTYNFLPSSEELTDRNGKDWYYLVRLELGI